MLGSGEGCAPRMSLDPVLLTQAKRAFDRAAKRACCVVPSVPILFFGDLKEYQASPLRVLTVGLNPSLHEFPAGEPFRRFRLQEDSLDLDPSLYLDSMSAYFRTDPYRGWFSALEPLLKGMGASYYKGGASTGIHTDICSPVATNPTWSQLGEDDKDALTSDGVQLWHMLLKELRPQIVVLSVAKVYLTRIGFTSMSNWEVIHVFERTASGALRSHPYKICARWYEVGGERSLFIFGRAANKPFGLISHKQKCLVGELSLKRYQDDR